MCGISRNSVLLENCKTGDPRESDVSSRLFEHGLNHVGGKQQHPPVSAPPPRLRGLASPQSRVSTPISLFTVARVVGANVAQVRCSGLLSNGRPWWKPPLARMVGASTPKSKASRAIGAAGRVTLGSGPGGNRYSGPPVRPEHSKFSGV